LVLLIFTGLDYTDSKADKSQLEKVATLKGDYHVFEVELENLLGAKGPVKHPAILARVIPDHICRCKFIIFNKINLY